MPETTELSFTVTKDIIPRTIQAIMESLGINELKHTLKVDLEPSEEEGGGTPSTVSIDLPSDKIEEVRKALQGLGIEVLN